LFDCVPPRGGHWQIGCQLSANRSTAAVHAMHGRWFTLQSVLYVMGEGVCTSGVYGYIARGLSDPCLHIKQTVWTGGQEWMIAWVRDVSPSDVMRQYKRCVRSKPKLVFMY
jgi:hypothetical protein